MAIGLDPARAVGGPEQLDLALRRLEDEWQRGRPDLGALWGEQEGGGPVEVLAAMVKADLGQRFTRGERPEVAEYLDRFPELKGEADRVLSLVYEEYCLREERGERPDTAQFCARYAEWKDSLESQLKYHRVISKVVGPPPAAPRYPARGELFQQYRIGAELGRGGSARVYLARDESLGGREVVLKVSADRGSEPSILGRLEHPHIVTVLNVVNQPETRLRGLVMPYRPGLAIDAVIGRVDPASRPRSARALWNALAAPRPDPGTPAPAPPGGPGWDGFPARGTYAQGVAWVIATLAEALAYAHARNVFHRDVKPANVLLTYREGPQLLDFNLSHDPHSAEQAEAALRGGTLPYMAPEQLEAFLDPTRWGEVVAPADIYSLGLLTRELLTGRGPETHDPSLPLPRAIRALIDRRALFRPGLRALDPRIPHALEAVIERCLAFAPADRYPDAASLAEDLRRFLDRRPLKHVPNPSARERSVNWAFRRRKSLAVACLAAALAVPAGRAASRRLFPPPEDRPAFRKAVEDLNAGNPEATLADLKWLSRDEQVSAVARFYEAAALARLRRYPEGFAACERTFSLSRAEASLTAWGRKDHDFAAHAYHLGATLIWAEDQHYYGKDFDRDTAAVLGMGERLFRLSLASDPDRKEVVQALAWVAGRRNDFPAAERLLTGLIAGQAHGTPASSTARTSLRLQLHSRARNSYYWGLNLLTTPGGFGRTEPDAVAHLGAALLDLDRADDLVEAGELGGRFDLNSMRCATLLALADAAGRRGDAPAAEAYNLQAYDLLGPLSEYPPDAAGTDRAGRFRVLQEQVKTRVNGRPPARAPAPGGAAPRR